MSTHILKPFKCKIAKPKGLYMPLRVWQYVTPEEAQEVEKHFQDIADCYYRIEQLRRKDITDTERRNRSSPLWDRIYRNKIIITGTRKALRHRREVAMDEGLYMITRKSIYGKQPIGMFGLGNYVRLNKGDVLMWSHRDELNRNFFVTQISTMVIVVGTNLDSIIRIQTAEE